MIGKITPIYKTAAKTQKDHSKYSHRDKPNSSFDELFICALSGLTQEENRTAKADLYYK